MRFGSMIVNPADAEKVHRARRHSSAARIAALVACVLLGVAAFQAGGWLLAVAVTLIAAAIGRRVWTSHRDRLTEDRAVFLPAYVLGGLYIPRGTDAIRLWKSATVMWSIRPQLERLEELERAEVLTDWRQAEYDALEREVDEVYDLAARILDPASADVR